MGSNHKLRVSTEGEVDRISNLPDDILSHILSFLPTKYAVLTSVLSSKWRFQWKTVDKIDVDYGHFLTDHEFQEGDCLARFTSFIEHVIGHWDSASIRKFRLYCVKRISSSLLQVFVKFAVDHNVEELDLNIRIGSAYELPQEFFTCKSLKVLTFITDYGFVVPSLAECFPNLKALRIWFDFCVSSFSEKLFCSCPKLETLLIAVGRPKADGRAFNVIAPLLRKLTIIADANFIGKFEVATPALEIIQLYDFAMACNLAGSFPNLRHATLRIGAVNLSEASVEHGDFVLQRVNQVANAKCFCLTRQTTTALSRSPLTSLCFPYLSYLDVTIYDFLVRKLLPNILRASPNLRVLILQVYKNEQPRKSYSKPQNWDSMVKEKAPFYLVQRLKIIKIRVFRGQFVERNVIKFLLEHANVLQKMTIEAVEPSIKDKFSKRILKIPRASSICRVEVV